jgi:predicted CXXCH cytochrome family protein
MNKKTMIIIMALAIILTLGISVAFSAPGDYAPDATSDHYTSTLTGQPGVFDTDLYGVDNSLENANLTGLYADINDGLSAADVIKAVYGQRVHGQYTKDTNSCASCHQTHTGSGAKMLFQNGSYNTCVACHDGTMGFYDVFTTGSNASMAGTFGGNPDKAVSNSSVHLATGVLTISSAPGGKRNSTDPMTWGARFTCISCHSPHGSFSDRLLHYNPNHMGTTVSTDAYGSLTGGRLMQNLVISFDENIDGGVYIAKDALGNRVLGPWVFGYPYGIEPRQYWSQIRIKMPGETEFSPLYDSEYTWNQVLEINYFLGFFKDPAVLIPPGSEIQMDAAPASVVSLQTVTVAYTPTQIPIVQVTGYNSGVNQFCSTCHTDYYASNMQPATTYNTEVFTEVYEGVYEVVYTPVTIQYPSGVFSQVYRHYLTDVNIQSGLIGQNNKLVCTSCHYAHGTEKSVMMNVYDEKGVVLDTGLSSALKRYANKDVCFKCHTDSKEARGMHHF